MKEGMIVISAILGFLLAFPWVFRVFGWAAEIYGRYVMSVVQP